MSLDGAVGKNPVVISAPITTYCPCPDVVNPQMNTKYFLTSKICRSMVTGGSLKVCRIHAVEP